MFVIQHIALTQFRNYGKADFDFHERIVAICGSNGIGKTNLLDAIHYLSMTKSYFNKPDSYSSQYENSGFRIHGKFSMEDDLKDVAIIVRENGKKELHLNHELVGKFSEHIGTIPLVFIAPDDTKLITGGSEERRNFMDTLISQWDHEYLLHLIRYTKTLQERNKFLKQLQEGEPNTHLLEVYNEQLVLHGNEILQKRILFAEEFNPITLNIFQFLSDKNEHPSIRYVASTSSSTYLTDLRKSIQKDILLQRTTVGVHKDDIEIQMDFLPFKQTASQGQKKCMLFACKLASYKMLLKNKGYEPILLLDDVFEKLDQFRLKKLLEWVCVKHSGQVIMTDTHTDRLELLMHEISLPFQKIQL